MSDLISRSALLESIKGVEVAWYIDGNYETYDDSTIVDIIEKQPTAYNVDKVVEELNDLIQRCCYCRESCNEKCLIERIIEIVKGGGVNEIKNRII